MISLLPRPDERASVPVVLQRTARRPQTIALVSAFVATTLCVAAPELLAQQGQAAEVPTIEPHFTRVYEVTGATQLRWPSQSPDGRWIAFSAWGDDDEVSLWLVPADGGEAIRLTEGHFDDQPTWFPSGDRIAFRSDRPARSGDGGYLNSYVVSLPIDPETGRPTGPPRQVSVDKVFAWLDVSPDGEWIVFRGSAVVVVPSAGGASRNVASESSRPVWSPDGKSLYYVVGHVPSGVGAALVRVSPEGGAADTMFTWPEHIRIFGYPQSSFVLRATSGTWRVSDRPSTWELTNLKGRALARLALPPGTNPFSFTLAGELLAVRYDISALLEVLPIDGGSPRRLNESRANDEALGWSGDGRRVLFKTSLDGEAMYFFAPSDGGPMRQVRLLERPLDRFPPILSADGRHLLYAVAGDERETSILKVLDLGDGRAREITKQHAPAGIELSGRGSAGNRDGNDFLYIEQRAERFELRASAPSGPSRLLRTYRGQLPASVAVCDDRIAYRQPRSEPARQASESEEQSSLVLARAGEDEPRALLAAVPGRGGFESPTWSTDCRRLAVKVYRMPPGAKLWETVELLVLEIDPSGDVIGEPTVLETPDAYWWGPKWLPSGRGLLVVADDGNIWRISMEPGARPVAITGDIPDSVWDFRISPDGQFIAYPRTIFRGSSIWRVDLGDVVARAER